MAPSDLALGRPVDCSTAKTIRDLHWSSPHYDRCRNDQRQTTSPTIQIEHHKTGARIEHPLEDVLDDGTAIRFYPGAEAILANLKRLGTPMILREVLPPTDKRYVRPGANTVSKPYSFSGMQKIVQRTRKEIGLPVTFTLDACRHGGTTELEEAKLTERQGRALSAHRTRESYAGYAKRTAPRILAATRKRRAHVLANTTQTEFRTRCLARFRTTKS